MEYFDPLFLVLMLQIESVTGKVLGIVFITEGMGVIDELSNLCRFVNHGENESLNSFLMGMNE